MAVQQNKKSPSKRGMHRAHDHLAVGLLPRQEGHPDQGIAARPLRQGVRLPALRQCRHSRGSSNLTP